MGNCLDRPPRPLVAGAVHCADKSAVLVEDVKENLHGKSDKAAPVTEVKIRITKKQLEELLRRLNEKDGSGGTVISELLRMTSSSNFRHSGQAGPWTPSLQSIPE